MKTNASAVVYMRLTPREKKQFLKASRRAKLSLSAWIRSVCREASALRGDGAGK